MNFTVDQLRQLLEQAYDEGFRSGVDAVRIDDYQRGLEVETLDIESRDSIIEVIMERKGI